MANFVTPKYTINFILGQLASRYVSWVFNSSKSISEIEHLTETVDFHKPCIFTFWRGQFMLLPPYCPEHISVAAIVARHSDVEIVGEIIKNFNQISLIRGGAGDRKKSRGGTTELLEAIRALGENKCVAITADVPPGPSHIVGKGVLKIAQMAGRPILPVAAASSRFYATQTWSRMTINFPFSNIAMRLGTPIYIPADADDMQLEFLRQQIQDSLNKITSEAYADVGSNSVYTIPYSALPNEMLPKHPNLKLTVYKAVTQLAANIAPCITWYRKKKGKEDPYRRSERLGIASVSRPDGALIWIHAASVGETIAILPLLQRIHSEYAGTKFLLTTGTVTSAKIAQERLPDGDIHQFAPFDAPQFITRFLNHWRPELVLMTESEIWPNTILTCNSRQIPIAIVNGRMSARTYKRWRRNKSIALPLFSRLNLVLAQNDQFVCQFRDLGARNVLNSGNIKIDAPRLPVNKSSYDKLSAALGNRPLWAAVSTHAGEDEKIIFVHNKLSQKFSGLMTIVAPRHPERGDQIFKLAKAANIIAARRSRNEYPTLKTSLYIIDTIGELGLIYSLVQIAFIGGSLVEHGGQNPIEAVRYETVVITGPDYRNFDDTYNALLSAGGALKVANELELTDAVDQLLISNDKQRIRYMYAANNIIENLSGGLEMTVSALKHLMPDNLKTYAPPTSECVTHAL